MVSSIRIIDGNQIEIDGRVVTHATVLAACCQDDESLCVAYRRLVRERILPAIRTAEQEAVSQYTSSGIAAEDVLMSGASRWEPETLADFAILARIAHSYAMVMQGQTEDTQL